MMKKCLSSREDMVRIELCGVCEDIHLTIGPISLRLSLKAFQGLASAVREAQTQLLSKSSA